MTEGNLTNIDKIWEETLAVLRKQLNVPTFKTMFQNTFPLNLQGSNLTIATPNFFIKEWLETRHSQLLSQVLKQVAGQELSVHFVVKTSQVDSAVLTDLEEQPVVETIQAAETKTTSVNGLKPPIFLSLNPRYTFDSFVVGASNRFAHAAALAVAESPATSYNPLFIYGGVGLGKTHLLQAIAHYVSRHHTHLKSRYITSEQFTNDFISAVKDRHIQSFQKKYRENDVLLIDDIQFLAGKERTQEEFFHTFNALYEARKQLVISCDRPPKDISTLETRLRSRFEWGLITDIQPPDLETKIAILQKKAQLESVKVPNEVLEFIASRIQSNIRELEGALNRVVAFSSLTSRPINLSTTEEVLQNIFSQEDKIITAPVIIEEACNYFKIKKTDILSSKRSQVVTYPRQIAMYLCRELTDLSLPKIGEEFGGRDHTTVLHAYTKINKLIRENQNTFNEVQYLTNKIKQRYR